jgi:hypothetical protein
MWRGRRRWRQFFVGIGGGWTGGLALLGAFFGVHGPWDWLDSDLRDLMAAAILLPWLFVVVGGG